MREPDAEDTSGPRVDGSSGVQVGSGNVQYNYFGSGWSGSGDAPLSSASPTSGAAGSGHAFMSYDRDDSGEVDVLQHLLDAAGVRVWRDTGPEEPSE